MKRILCVLLVVVVGPGVALADKNFTKGKGATWDCKQDPVVNINHGNATYKLKGTCTTVNISGGSLKITAERIDQLNVSGAKNTITLDTVGSINVTGAKNKIAYKSGDAPTISDVGVGNVIAKPSGTTASGSGSGSAAGTGVGTAAASGTVIDCAKTPTFSQNDNDGTFTLKGKCTKVAIAGNNNTLSVESATTVTTSGNNNTVRVSAVDVIATPGNNNTVAYKTSVTANAKVKVSNPGNGNTISVAK